MIFSSWVARLYRPSWYLVKLRLDSVTVCRQRRSCNADHRAPRGLYRTSAGANNSHSLVQLRTTGKGQPLFLVHNRYCFVMYYRHLLSTLRSDRPVFGLKPPPLDGSHHIPRTVETMAADYVLEIRRAQPRGPYFLAGHFLAAW